jgi:hypothetical protein
MRRGDRAGIREMRKRTAGGKNIPLAVIILAFFHRFLYHYGALSQKKHRIFGAFFLYLRCFTAILLTFSI